MALRPEPRVQIRLGVIAAALIVLALAVAAFVPDPFFRQRLYESSVDNADGVTAGAPVGFMGGSVGKVRWIRLDPKTNLYTVGLGLRRDWPPPACSVVRISAANPLTSPKVEVVAPSALGGAPEGCTAFRLANSCATVIRAPASAAHGLDGCARQGDLMQLVASAVAGANRTVAQGEVLVAKLNTLTGGLGKPGSGGKSPGGLDFATVAKNVTNTTASVDQIVAKVNATLSPQRQADLSASIGNLRTVSNKAAAFDVAQVQATVQRTNTLLEQMTGLLEENRQSVKALTTQAPGLAQDTRELLGSLQASMSAATANLERTSANLDALSERLKGDPTYALRGSRFADPPAPGARR